MGIDGDIPTTAAEALAWQAAHQEKPKRSNAGRREDLGGLYVRSTWEANYARYCNWLKTNGQIKDWRYEFKTFWFAKIKRGVVSYKPDFAIWETSTDPETPDYYVEVKGWDYAKGVTARKRMAKYHPGIRLILVDADAYRALKKWKSLIPGWEDGRNVAAVGVEKEWPVSIDPSTG